MQSGGEIPRSLSERWGGGSESRTRATSERHSDHAASPTRALHYELLTCQAYESTRREFSLWKKLLLISAEECWMCSSQSCTRDNEQCRTIKINTSLVSKRKRVSLHAMAATHALDSAMEPGENSIETFLALQYSPLLFSSPNSLTMDWSSRAKRESSEDNKPFARSIEVFAGK